MKKFYILFFSGILLALTNKVTAQYTATATGAWSNNGTWGPGTKPASPCSGCTITINAGVTVTLDVSIKFTGGTVLTIGSDNTSPAALIIPSSGGTSIASGFNILLDFASPTTKIVLKNPNVALAAIPGGQFDGIFTDIANGTVDVKTVGNPNLPAIIVFGNTVAPPPNPGPTQSAIAGPATLTSNGTLPIFLDHFNAVLNGKQVDLEWATLVEINGDHFGVERSIDGFNWTNLSNVTAIGNSETKTSYSYVDRFPVTGANYYRLQMMDKDGKYKYSPVKVVRGAQIKGYSVFPNPARDYVNLTMGVDAPSEITVRLVSASGAVLQERKYNQGAGSTVSIPVFNYPTGNYVLTITGKDGSSSVNKVLITH
jgi:hypothetical protein